MFDSHSKDENGNLSSSGAGVLLKFDTFHSLENYTRRVYYNAYPVTLSIAICKSSLHCQCQECHKMFIKKGAIVSKATERFESSKKKISCKSRKEKTGIRKEI